MPLFTQRESRPAWFHETDQSQWLRPGLGDYLGAAAEDAWEGLPTVALGRLGEMAALSAQATGTDVELDESGTPVISHERQPMSILPTEEQASIIDAHGLKGQIMPQPGYSRDMLDVVMERKKAELARQATREAAPGIYAPLGFATELGISLFDPINVASAFVPVVGEARVLSMLGRASGALGRAGVRAGVGTVEGAVGAAMIEPVIALAQTQQQADYDMSDALGNIAFGAAFGAAMHPAAGAVGDWLRSRRGQRQPWQIMPDTDESLALMRRHRDAIRDARIFAGADEARAAEESAAAAALFDARARRWAYDFNQPVAAFYDRYMPDYRAVREGKDALSQAALYEQTPMGDAARASLERDIHDFGAAVDNIVAAGKLPSDPVKMLGQTPLVMQLLGRDSVTGKAAAQGGIYAAPHVFDGTHPNMTPEMWKQIPAAMADPIAVFDSDSPAGRARGDLVFMLELTDASGATVVVPVALQAKGKLGARINIVKSAYAKESGGVPSNHWFTRQVKKNARYVNGQKWKHWRDIGSGADSPLVVPTNASGNTIHTEADLVNLRQGNAALYQPKTNAVSYPNNGRAVGSISPEIARTLRLDKPGAIVLDDIGLQHIEDRHGKEIRGLGFADARAFVDAVLADVNAVYAVNDGGRKYDLVSRAMLPQGRVMVRLEFARTGDFYSVATAGPIKMAQYKKKKPLWESAPHFQSGITDSVENTPRVTGQSGMRQDAADKISLAIGNREVNGEARARITFDAAEGGRAVIEFFSAADASSAPHELYHIFRREMAESAARPDAPQRVREDWARIEEFVGAEPGQAWTREMEEKFARAGERFLLEGKAPTPALQGVFERLRQWFLELYANADAAGLHISPAMREVFGNMLSVPAEQGDMAFRKALGELLSRPVDPVEPAAVPPLPADAPPLETMQAMTVEAEQDLGRALGELEQALPGGAANLRAVYDAETALIDADMQKSVQVRAVLEEAARCFMRN
ncbi:hypothetical protein AB9L11_11915 [Desulfovibrio piger]